MAQKKPQNKPQNKLQNKPKNAREVALEVLNKFDKGAQNISAILNEFLPQTKQRAHATDLVCGVIRNRMAIDMIMSKIAAVPIKKIDRKAINVLRIGTYEIVFVPSTAEYAIVNSLVSIAGSTAGKKQSGFANAVLRTICTNIENRDVELTDENIQKVFPHAVQRGCEFKTPFLASPEKNEVEYLNKAFSMPKWFLTACLEEFGPEMTKDICCASNRRPGIYLKPNTLKTTFEGFGKMLSNHEIEAKSLPEIEMFKLKSHIHISEIEGYQDGLFFVQDPTAAKVSRILDPSPGQTIVDFCSAPGGKTMHIAQLMGGKGKVLATDIDSKRLEKVEENACRLGTSSVEVVEYDDLPYILAAEDDCDAILLDVQCSNTGVLARRCEVRLRMKPKKLDAMGETQYELLHMATAMVKPHGKICYSTCSILKRENSDMIARFLADNPDFKLVTEELTLPEIEDEEDENSYDHDGGYVAILARK